MPILINSGYFQSLKYYNVTQTPSRTVIHFEFELFESGTGATFLNGVSYPHKSHRLLLAKPGIQRFTIGSFIARYVRVAAETPEEMNLLHELPETTIVDDDHYALLTQKITDIMQLNDDMPYYSRLSALSLFLAEATQLLHQENRVQPAVDPHLSAVLTAKAYLEEHFCEKINLDFLSSQVHLSKNFFRQKFCQHMCLSPQEYLHQVRLAHAKELLRTTHVSLSEIADACGFESQSYFTYVFRMQTGQTPFRYRQSSQTNE